MNSDVRTEAAEASVQITESRLRKEIHDIVNQSWASLTQSRERDFPDELGRFIQQSLDEVFTRHLSGGIGPDRLERIKSECARLIQDFLLQALRGGLLDRHQVQLHALIDDFLDDEFSEDFLNLDRSRVDEEKSASDRRSIPAGAPGAEVGARDAPDGGTLAGGPPKPAEVRRKQAAPAPQAPSPAPSYSPAPTGAASDALQVERGKLVEKIPRTMYVGVREIVEVRLGLPSEDLTAGLAGGGLLTEHGVWMVETMSIKLVSPDGAFDIEARSPETQLVKKDVLKGSPLEALVTNFGQWIWMVVPQQRGSHPLQLSISASVRDTSGLPGSATLPNQTIPIEVAVSLTVTTRRLFWWILSAGASGAVTTLIGVLTRDYWWPVLKNWLSLP